MRTLGELRLDGGSTAGLSSPRIGLTLLAYLARRSPRAVGRGELADLFWRERDTGRARQSLRQVLLELRRIVGPGLDTADKVCLAPGTLGLDAASFESHVAAGRWSEAVAAWQGEFLADADNLGGADFRLWLEAERQRLHGDLRLALRHLIQQARANGHWQEGAGWAQRWVDSLPLEEEGHLQLIELTQLDGRHSEALARYTGFRSRLRETESEPTAAFLALGAVLERHASGASGRRTPGSAALFSPDLTGRGHAMAELEAVWQGVRTGKPDAILVEGEAGIGKSRLCEEFLRHLGSQRGGPTVLRARGYEATPRTALSAIAELAVTLVAAPGAAGASAAALAELAELAPGIRDRFPSLPRALNSGGGLEDALVEVLNAAGTERPVVLYFDDMPLADSATQQVLMAVSGRVSAALLFLVTARTGEDRTSSYVELSSRAGIRRLKLQPLGVSDVELLLGSMLELAPAARHHLAQRLYAETTGNPFYTIELTAALVDEGLLSPTDAGAWRLDASETNTPIPLPATIREVVGRRLDRLSPESRSAAEAAAVLGRTFDPGLVPDVAGIAPSTWAVAQEELIARRMVRGVPDSPDMYEFTHEIIRRVAYDMLSVERREALHRAAAEAWRSSAPRGAPARVAYDYHRTRAGSRPGRRRWRTAALGVAFLFAVVASLAMVLIPPEQRASLVTLLSRETPPLIPHRIVVAPLTNHTGDSALAALGALAADWIAQSLMRTTQFEVVDPRTASVAGRIVEGIPAILRDRNQAIAIAEETGSGTVVSGDLFREGDSLRVLMQVIDAGTGKIIRAMAPVSGTAAEPTRLVTTLGEDVLAAVASAVDSTSRGFSAALAAPPSYEAYTEMSKAWESFFRNDIADVFRRLDRATLLDSAYTTPLLMRAYVETRLTNWPAVDTLVRRLTRRSATLTPAERAVLAGLQADLQGDLWGRLRSARELIGLTPASVEGYTLAASSALFVNRPREALAILSRIDPDRGLLLVAPYYWVTQSPALHRLGDHRAELESARQGLRRFPDRSYVQLDLLLALAAAGDTRGLRREFPRAARDDADPVLAARQKALYVWRELRAHGHTAAAAGWLDAVQAQAPIPFSDTTLAAALIEGDLLAAADRWTEARARYAGALPRSPDAPALLGRLGTTAAHLGDQAEALRLDRALAALSTPYLFGANTYARARIAAALGEQAQAVELLRAAWAQGRPLAYDDRENEDVHTDPELESLGEFIAFQALMRTD